MNCRLSCLSERSCRRCMYRYARATRTLRAVAALLALHADELAGIHALSHRRHSPFSPTPPLVQPFSLMPLPSSSSWRRSPSLRVPSFLFLRGVVCLWRLPLFASSAASSKFAWRGRNAGPRGDVLQSRRRVGNAWACRDIAIK